MIYTVLPIIILVFEFGLIGYYIYSAVKTQKFISKGTIAYFVPISLILFVIYTLGANYNSKLSGIPLTLVDYLGLGKSVISATVFELKIDYVSQLMNVNKAFELSYFIAVGLSIACVYTSVISLVINTITNQVRVWYTLRNNCDILIGENEYNFKYINRSKNVILILDSLKSNNLNDYYSKKIPVISGKFTKTVLLKNFKWYIKSGKELNFISFQDSDKNLGYIKEFEEFLNSEIFNKKVLEYKNTFLKVEIDFSNQLSIKNKILENKVLAPFIDCFTRYELFALDFIEKNPITENLPRGFINDETGTINEDKTINVIYLGFGKLAKTLHRVQLMNDQLPVIRNNKIGRYKINYFAFDKEKSAFEDKTMNFFFRRYDENIDTYSSNKYFPSCEKLDNLITEEVNIESYSIITKILKILKENNDSSSFNRIIISYGKDIDNIDMAIKIQSLLIEQKYNNFEMYVKVKNKFPSVIKLLDDKRINVIGDLDSVFNHDVIVNERIYELAKLVNRKYESKRLADSSWYSLTTIKQASNVYSSLNIRLKLNLLGYDYVRENDLVNNDLLIEEIEKKVKFEKGSYDDYLFYKHNRYVPVHSLAYQEHLRWNAFYIGNGYVPLKKEDIKLLDVEGPNFYKDDSILNLHACLTTFEGLDEYHRLLANLLTLENGKPFNDNLDTVETYKYDHMIIESIKPMFKNSKFRLIRK
jgi:hypothetical protein